MKDQAPRPTADECSPVEERKPWAKWYFADWRADPKLRMCSLSARGLWADLLGFCHEAEPYGYLLIEGVSPTVEEMASLVGRPLREVRDALAELEKRAVFSRDGLGRIYSRRMVRDAAKAARDQANGKRGGNPRLRYEDNGGGNRGGNPGDNGQVNPPDKAQRPEARGQKPETSKAEKRGSRAKRAPARAKTPLPLGFAISDRVRQWASEKGHSRLDERFEHFVGKARANGYAYVDWDEALMTAIRDDWARLNGKPAPGVQRLTSIGQKTASNLAEWRPPEPRENTA